MEVADPILQTMVLFGAVWSERQWKHDKDKGLLEARVQVVGQICDQGCDKRRFKPVLYLNENLARLSGY